MTFRTTTILVQNELLIFFPKRHILKKQRVYLILTKRCGVLVHVVDPDDVKAKVHA